MYAILFSFKFFFSVCKFQFKDEADDTLTINKNNNAAVNAAFNAIFYNNIIKHKQ